VSVPLHFGTIATAGNELANFADFVEFGGYAVDITFQDAPGRALRRSDYLALADSLQWFTTNKANKTAF